MSTCTCLSELEKLLSEHEAGIAIDSSISVLLYPSGKSLIFSRVKIGLHRSDGSKRRIKSTLVASFCPFCGKKYPDEKSEATTDSPDGGPNSDASEVQP